MPIILFKRIMLTFSPVPGENNLSPTFAPRTKPPSGPWFTFSFSPMKVFISLTLSKLKPYLLSWPLPSPLDLWFYEKFLLLGKVKNKTQSFRKILLGMFFLLPWVLAKKLKFFFYSFSFYEEIKRTLPFFLEENSELLQPFFPVNQSWEGYTYVYPGSFWSGMPETYYWWVWGFLLVFLALVKKTKHFWYKFVFPWMDVNLRKVLRLLGFAVKAKFEAYDIFQDPTPMLFQKARYLGYWPRDRQWIPLFLIFWGIPIFLAMRSFHWRRKYLPEVWDPYPLFQAAKEILEKNLFLVFLLLPLAAIFWEINHYRLWLSQKLQVIHFWIFLKVYGEIPTMIERLRKLDAWLLDPRNPKFQGKSLGGFWGELFWTLRTKLYRPENAVSLLGQLCLLDLLCHKGVFSWIFFLLPFWAWLTLLWRFWAFLRRERLSYKWLYVFLYKPLYAWSEREISTCQYFMEAHLGVNPWLEARLQALEKERLQAEEKTMNYYFL